MDIIPDEKIARFWSWVDKSGGPDSCWEWQGSRGIKGYGACTLNWVRGAHRIAYMLAGGVFRLGKNNRPLVVMHTCDNPPCCNPAHLKLGSAKENIDDMIAKGRARWQRKYQSLVQETPILELLQDWHDQGLSANAMVKKLGGNRQAALKLIRAIISELK